MLEKLLRLARESSYDFRRYAPAADPLAYLFEEWVPDFRLKWALARALQPSAILEVGACRPYTERAFLDACPSARHLGIAADIGELPTGRWDLICLPGDCAHLVTLALEQARWVLVDGYFCNLLELSTLLERNRHLYEHYTVLPTSTGMALIAASGAGTLKDARASYTSAYYLSDCGGYDSWKRTRGRRLEDPRLSAVARLADTVAAGRALDLGCGRGEISAALAEAGHEVTAIDYSPDAIRLARETMTGNPRVTFFCAGVNEAPLDGRYDVVVASDLIEHLESKELKRLYARVAGHLSPRGIFLIHTFPNLWFYRYEYARRRRIARGIGAWLPANPRSRYEESMHVNEQSPGILHRQLRKYFPHVLLWFAEHGCGRPVENLTRRFRIAEMRAAGDLFAVASHAPINPADFARALRMEAIPPVAPGEIAVELRALPDAVSAGEFRLDAAVSNNSGNVMQSRDPHPVNLAYHWLDRKRRTVVHDGIRTPLRPWLPAHSRREYEMRVLTPPEPRAYILRVTLVQEGVQWFDTPPANAFCDAAITVSPR